MSFVARLIFSHHRNQVKADLSYLVSMYTSMSRVQAVVSGTSRLGAPYLQYALVCRKAYPND